VKKERKAKRGNATGLDKSRHQSRCDKCVFGPRLRRRF